eukprot:scaffold322929_cov18-Tisochrysis_lutea.AAC.1
MHAGLECHLRHSYCTHFVLCCGVQGDRLDTDIVLGAEGGLKTIMPLTGVTTLEELEDAKK